MHCAHVHLQITLIHAIHEPCARYRGPHRTWYFRKRVKGSRICEPAYAVKNGDINEEDDEEVPKVNILE